MRESKPGQRVRDERIERGLPSCGSAACDAGEFFLYLRLELEADAFRPFSAEAGNGEHGDVAVFDGFDDMSYIEVSHERDRQLAPDRLDLQKFEEKIPFRFRGEAKHCQPRIAYLKVSDTLHLLAENGGGKQCLGSVFHSISSGRDIRPIL